MTTEARDALAKALHAAVWGPLADGVMHGEVENCGCIDEADAILAALDGWTLVPVDTVADAEALHGKWHIDGEPGRWWAYQFRQGETVYRDGTGPTIASAVRAALGASDDE